MFTGLNVNVLLICSCLFNQLDISVLHMFSILISTEAEILGLYFMSNITISGQTLVLCKGMLMVVLNANQ